METSITSTKRILLVEDDLRGETPDASKDAIGRKQTIAGREAWLWIQTQVQEWSAGVIIDYVQDVSSALKKIETEKYDLIITDLGLPFADAELAKKFHEIMALKEKATDYMKLVDELAELSSIEIGKADKRIEYLRFSKTSGDDALTFYRGCMSGPIIPLSERIYFSAGVIIAQAAKEKGIPLFLYTSSSHWALGVLGATHCGIISQELWLDIFTQEIIAKGFDREAKLFKFKTLFIGYKFTLASFVDVIKSALTEEPRCSLIKSYK